MFAVQVVKVKQVHSALLEGLLHAYKNPFPHHRDVKE